MKSIFDRGFKYVPSLETDVGRTFARIRRQQLKKKGLTLRSLSNGAENVVSVTVQDMPRIAPGRTPTSPAPRGRNLLQQRPMAGPHDSWKNRHLASGCSMPTGIDRPRKTKTEQRKSS
jgi:hypothetical protein